MYSSFHYRLSKIDNMDANNGKVIPAEEYFTSAREGGVKIRYSDFDVPVKTLPDAFTKLAEQYPDEPVLHFKENPDDEYFKFITLRGYLDHVRDVAKAFIELGLGKLGPVIILGANSPQWCISHYGAIFAGGCAGGLYTTNYPTACLMCMKKVNAEIVVVDDDFQLQKILECKDEVPSLKAIIQIEGVPKADGVLSWNELLMIGRALDDGPLNERLAGIRANQIASIVFTSGTTGEPKAVMLSHDNMYYEAAVAKESVKIAKGNKVISYLPLCHVAAQVLDIFCCPLVVPLKIYFAKKDAMKGSLFQTIKEVRPDIFLSVPRIFEKLAEVLKIYLQEKGGPLYELALEEADRLLERDANTYSPNPSLEPFYQRVKEYLGFQDIASLLVGAAPLPVDIKKWFLVGGLLLRDVYGLSESTGLITHNEINFFNFKAAGIIVPGTQMKILNPDSNGEGEVCFNGRSILMGYMNDEAKTREVCMEDGWFLSGDVGRIDKNGFLFITGRIKEIIITAGGENVPPTMYENVLKKELPFLSQAIMIGDRRKYLIVLLTLGCAQDPSTGLPSEKLSELSQKWIDDLQLPFKTVTEVVNSGPHPKVVDSIQNAIEICNTHAISNAQKVQKFAILQTDFSIATGELGPTLKLKRSFVADKYKDIIEKLYE